MFIGRLTSVYIWEERKVHILWPGQVSSPHLVVWSLGDS